MNQGSSLWVRGWECRLRLVAARRDAVVLEPGAKGLGGVAPTDWLFRDENDSARWWELT